MLVSFMRSLQAQMESSQKEKGDMFDIMVVDEAKIRLGEEGWKERYYQVLFLLQSVYMQCYMRSSVLELHQHASAVHNAMHGT